MAAIFAVTNRMSGITCVVRANCLNCAREAASKDDPSDAANWLDTTATTVSVLDNTGRSKVLLKGVISNAV